MELTYDVNKYLAQIKMSSKKRILVEGRDDKSHIKNLLDLMLPSASSIKVDTAESIKGDCCVTAKNNKAKIEKIFNLTKSQVDYDNIYFFCDREFLKFSVDDQIRDHMVDHESEGNIAWTIGHSLENYFYGQEIVIDAYKYLCGSEFKSKAFILFDELFVDIFRFIAAVTLAAKEIEKASFPIGTIEWRYFSVENKKFEFNVDQWSKDHIDLTSSKFIESYLRHIAIATASTEGSCIRVCRGHTAMIFLQRIFSLCIYFSGCDSDESIAMRDANHFSQIKEDLLANALCESWLRHVGIGRAIYPTNLLGLVA